MTDHGEEANDVPPAQPESMVQRLRKALSGLKRPENIGEKLRGAVSQLGQFCLGAGIALLTLGVLTGVIVLVLLGYRKFF